MLIFSNVVLMNQVAIFHSSTVVLLQKIILGVTIPPPQLSLETKREFCAEKSATLEDIHFTCRTARAPHYL